MSELDKQRIWFITGASKGLGFAYTQSALQAGDKVVAVARTDDTLQELKKEYKDNLFILKVDITDRGSVFGSVRKAVANFGQLDIVVNNAGAMTMGMVEELSEEEARNIMDLNFFGSLWVIQAVMPFLRKQGFGHIIQISSIGGLITGPMSGIYSASKFALEGLCDALAQEAAYFGIRVTIVEPGGYWTELYNTMQTATPNNDYQKIREDLEKLYSAESVDSDPKLAAEAILKLVELEKPPLRLILGSKMFDLAIDNLNEKIKTFKQYESISREAEKAIPAPEGYGS